MLASRLQGSPNLSQGSRAQLLVWQTYWIDEQFVTSDYRAKLTTALARLRGRGDDGAIIVLYAKADDEPQATQLLAQFSREQLPELLQALRDTRSRR